MYFYLLQLIHFKFLFLLNIYRDIINSTQRQFLLCIAR